MSTVTRRLLSTTCLTAAIAFAAPLPSLANPTGGSVSAGSATISSAGNTLTVNQQSNRAVINWSGFDINSGETTQFEQPSSGSIALNRVFSSSASQIDGNLNANGNIVIINQNGVVFGAGAKVDVNSLVVSTANIDDNTFMNTTGKFAFSQPGNPNAQIVNNGQITAAQAGLVGFVAPNVINNGTITAKLGRIQLASGDTATVDLYGDGLMEVAVSPAVASQLISNAGTIQADGGTIQLSAAAGAAIVHSLIMNTGTLQAQTVSAQNGKIIIASAGSQVGSGHQNRTGSSTVQIAGTVDATGDNPGETGGKVRILADDVSIQPGALIDASGDAAGGSVKIEAAQVSQQGTILAQSAAGNGGNVDINFTALYADTANSITSVASASSSGGTISVNGGDDGLLYALGAYLADGNATGGSIGMMAGQSTVLAGAFVSAQGEDSGGNISIGGDYVDIIGTRRSSYTGVDQNTLILASAANDGNGGNITVSGNGVNFQGTASAEGGPNGGNGGNITVYAPANNGGSVAVVSGTLEASGYGAGGMGGNVSVLGDNVGLMSGALIDASGDAGGGYVKVGGDFHGEGVTPTAQNTYVDPEAFIFANAVTEGNGGNVAVWSDGTTEFYGNIMAEGGAASGNGGFVETSGHGTLDAEGYVDLTAPNGEKGTYLLDPSTIEIYGNVTPAFNATDSSISLSSSLQLWLDASNTSSITLSYNSTGTTASGSSGGNTITVGSNSGLVVGERIQLGGSTHSYAASVNDNSSDGVYTITAINGTTITLDANLSSTYSSVTLYGGFVSQINDQSGNSNNATQSTASDMPLWISDGQNGIGVISFNGTSDYLNGTSNAAGGSLPFSVSLWFSAGSQSSNYPTMVSNDDYTAGNGWLVGFEAYTTQFGLTEPNVGSVAYTSSGLSSNTGYIGIVTVNGSGSTTVYTDGLSQATTGSHSFASSGNNLRIGADSGCGSPCGFFNGYISDVTIYSTNLSTNAEALLPQYESAKYGTALTGPGNATGESGLTGAEAQAAMASTQAGAAVDGYSVFADTYLERLSQTSNIKLEASGDITLDLQGDNMSLSAGKSIALTSTGGNIDFISPGTITTNNAGITLTPGSTGSIVLNSNSAVTLASQGGAIDLAGAVSLGSALTVNSGGGAVTFDSTVDGAHNLTVNAGNAGSATFTGEVGSNTPLGAFSVTAGGGIALNAVTATSISLDSSGGSGNIASNNSGILDATSGTITVNSGGDVDFSNIGMETSNQAVSVTAAGDASLNAIDTGTGSLTVSANNVYLYGGGLADPAALVGYWNFNEGSGTTATDDSGNGNTGTINGATYSTSVPAALGSGDSLSFNGSSNYVDLGNTGNLTFTSSNFTISSWVYVTNNSGYNAIVNKGDGLSASGSQYELLASNSSTPYFRFDTFQGSNNNAVTDPSAHNLNQWYYVVGVRNGSTDYLYVNGSLVASATYAGTLNTTSNNTAIGASGTGSQLNFNGLIDDARVYNAALSAQDVANLYAGVPQWSVGTANITAAGNITTDIMGTTLTAGAGKNITMTAGGSITNDSPATISSSQSGGSGGNVTLKAGTDIVLPNLTMNTGGGNITFDADTASGGGAISLTDSTLTSGGGNITLGGNEANPANIVAGTGYAVGDATLENAFGSYTGIYTNDATINAGAGNIILNGDGYSTGTGGQNWGVGLTGTIETSSGNVTINGIGGTATGYGTGVVLLNGGVVTTTSGTIAITGTGSTGGGYNEGINIYNSGTVGSTGTGSIILTGIAGVGGGSYGGAHSQKEAKPLHRKWLVVVSLGVWVAR